MEIMAHNSFFKLNKLKPSMKIKRKISKYSAVK